MPAEYSCPVAFTVPPYIVTLPPDMLPVLVHSLPLPIPADS